MELRHQMTKIQNVCTAKACIQSLVKDGSLARIAVNGLIVAVQEWTITMTKLFILERFANRTTLKYSIPHLTQGGTPFCPIGGARWRDLVTLLKLIFL